MDFTPQYQVLASEILSRCPSGFSEAKLEARLSSGFARMSLTCVGNDGETLSLPLGGAKALPLDRTIGDMRDRWPTGPFSRCYFILQPNGQFSFDVSYDEEPT